MSIADIAARGSATIVRKDVKIAVLDIERMKGRAEIEFWDLGDFKNRRIHADDVQEWPRTICVAWKWYDRKAVDFAAEWEDGGPEAMLRRAWDVYDTADIVVGHNLQNFDSKKLQGGWKLLGLPKPSPFKTVDTLKVARTELGFESNTLDALCKRLGIPAKTDKYDVEVARRACAGDVLAQRKLKAYNVGDIHATQALYDALRGWMPSHPHIGTLDEAEERCNQCGGTNLEKVGTYLAIQIRYVGYRCLDCGANLRGAAHSRAANVRGAR